MIIYYDLRPTPLFKQMFEASGVGHVNHYRSKLSMYAMRHRIGRRIPRSMIYSRPAFKDGDDKIIVFDSYASVRQLEWLHSEYPDKRIILWFWNVINNVDWLHHIPTFVEMWSYSATEAERFGIGHNTQFFFDCLAQEALESRMAPPVERTPRAFFIGRDKGRGDEIRAIGRELEEAGLDVELDIVPDISGKLRALREHLVPYRKVIDRVKEADILVDYVGRPDAGLSLRSMESIFFGKKLVTNNHEIEHADFYDPANIYLLGRDERSLAEFAACPMVPIADEIRDQYLLSNWLKRFDERPAR